MAGDREWEKMFQDFVLVGLVGWWWWMGIHAPLVSTKVAFGRAGFYFTLGERLPSQTGHGSCEL